jgi:hypothetical protein
MQITREMKDDVNRRLQYNEDYLDDAGYAFYYRCLYEEYISLLDADDYAVLNTLIGYDIGLSAAMDITGYLWENEIDTKELVNSDEDKALISKAIADLQLDINLDKWGNDPRNGFVYFEEVTP